MVMLQRKWGMHHPRRGDGMPRGGKKDGEPSVKSDQRMVNTSPRVAELGVKIGRAHVCTALTNAQLVCRLLLDTDNTNRQLTDKSAGNHTVTFKHYQEVSAGPRSTAPRQLHK